MEVEKAQDPAAAAEAATRAGTRRTRDGFSFFDTPEVSSCLGSVGGFMFGFGEECSLRSWRERRRLQPQRREVCDYCLWLRRNIFALLLLGLAGVVTWESSVQALRINMNRTIVFPLYLPAAFALSLSCVWKASIVPGNLAGLYISRLYMLWRGHARFDTWAIVFLFLASVLEALEAQTCGYYMRKFLCKRGSNKSVPSIDTVRDALWYILLIVGCTLLFDFMIALCITVTPLVPWSSFWRFWATWWLGVLAAMMSISPAVTHLMAWECQPSLKKPLKITEWLLLLLINIGLLLVIFVIPIHTFIRPLPYIFFPLIMYMGFRCNRLGWALTVSSITYMCSWASIRGRGSLYITLGRPSPASSHLILEVELFNAVIGIVGITLAAAVREKKQLTKELHQMNIDLEHTVDERTTELRKAHEEAQMSQRKAEQASHAKSDFLANMSHEIRTPIHGILGLTALLLESELSDEQKESLMSVKECADLLLHIINSVLDLAKIESGRLEVERVPFNIEKMVSSTLRMLQARAQERGLQLLWEVDRQVPQVLVGDVGKIQQCLLNLVGNALKFTHEGSVTIRVTVMDQQEISSSSSNKSVSIDADEHCGQELLTESLLIKFEVRDTGIGISKEKLKDMFKPFTQADASTSRLYGGTGLGLCIVQRFVELLGGKICAESEANKGSTFYFCLPLLLTTSKDSPGEISPRAPNQDKPQTQSWSLMGGLIFTPPVGNTRVELSNQISGIQGQVSSCNSTAPFASESDGQGQKLLPVEKSAMSFEDCSYLTGDHVSEEDNCCGSAQESGPTGVEIGRSNDLEKVFSHSSSMDEAKGDPIIDIALHEPQFSPDGMYLIGRGTQENNHFWSQPEFDLSSTPENEVNLNNRSASIEIGNSECKILPGAPDVRKHDSNLQELSELKTVFAGSSGKNVNRIQEFPLPVGGGDSWNSSRLARTSLGKVASSKGIRGERGSVTALSEVSLRSEALLEAFKSKSLTSEFDMSGKILDQIGNISTKGRGYKDRKLNILLAEDNEINQKVASRQLEKHGHSVMIVSDGQQALDVVRSQHNTLDLVLMDVQMPIMDGLLATQLIRQEEMERGWSRIPILGLTAHAIDGYQDKCFSHGMDSYLGKPFDIRQLLSTIGHILPFQRLEPTKDELE